MPGLVLPSRPANARHAWHLYQVRVTAEFGVSRDDVIDELRSLGIGTSVHFIPVHQLSAYRRILGPEEIASVPVTDRVAAELLSLPMYPALADRDVDHIAGALAAIAARPSRGRDALRNGGERVELAGHTA